MTKTSREWYTYFKHFLLSFFLVICTASTVITGTSIKQVNHFSDESKTRIIFESDKTLVYSAYTSQDNPSTLIIDFPDTNLEKVKSLIEIFSTEIKYIKFSKINLDNDAFILRAQFELPQKLPYHISQYQNFMYVDLRKLTASDLSEEDKNINNPIDSLKKEDSYKPGVTESNVKTTAQPTVLENSQPKYSSVNLPSQLNEITYDLNGNNFTVNLNYSGRPEYSTFELEAPERLIVDLHRTVNRVYPKLVEVNASMVKRIRTAQFQTDPVQITRVVFDINRPINYRIIEGADHIKVAFGEDSYISEVEKSVLADTVQQNNSITEATNISNISNSEKDSIKPDDNLDVVDIGPREQAVAVNIQEMGTEDNSKNTIKSESSGKIQENLFETANPATNPPALLGDQERGSDVESIASLSKRQSADEIYGKKLVSEGKKYTGDPLSIKFKDADVKDIIQIFGEITGKNFIVDPGVRGKVTINFTNVPWDQALEIILSINNLGMVEENNIIIVATLERLEDKAKKERKLDEERELSGPIDVITRRISYAKASEVANIVKSYLTKRGQVIVDKRTNLLIIQELKVKMQGILDLIDELDIATRQVSIEARIIETNKNYTKDLGIQWGWRAVADDAHGNATRYIWPHDITFQGGAGEATGIGGVPYAINLPAASPTSGIALSLGNILDSVRLDAALTAMEERGQGRILSSPSVATQNNIEATILSGAKIPYTSIVDNTATVTFINAKLELKVTPQITSDNTIIMDVSVEKTEPDYSRLITNVQGALPTILEKKAESTMLVKDGGTAVIGGILQINDSQATRVTPFFHKIPLIGWLFKADSWKRTDFELLIFITPKILGYE